MASRKNSLVGTRVAERLLCTVVIGVLVVVTVLGGGGWRGGYCNWSGEAAVVVLIETADV